MYPREDRYYQLRSESLRDYVEAKRTALYVGMDELEDERATARETFEAAQADYREALLRIRDNEVAVRLEIEECSKALHAIR